MKVEVSSVTDASELVTIAEGLGEHALCAGIEPRNAQPLCVLLLGDRDQLAGGLSATTVWGWLHVKELWITENIRRSDFGISRPFGHF